MPIPFTCPHCGAQTNVEDRFAGRTGPCGSCGQTITVPQAGGVLPSYSRPRKSSSAPIVAIIIVVVLVVLLACGGLLLALLLPAVQAAREAARRSQCSNNLKQIAVALLNYHEVYRSFPPAVITNDDGTPMRSWRVAILPYANQEGLFDQYDFDVPWDHPNNESLTSIPLTQYQCPSVPPSGECDANYVMVVGQGTLGGKPNEGVKMRDITDGTSNTIAVIEIGGSGIHWMEPRDLTVEEVITHITDPGASPFKPTHPFGVNVAMADGSVSFIPNSIDPNTLRALLTRSGGEIVGGF